MNKEPEKIFVELIKASLNLPDNYGYDSQGNEIPCITIKSQNVKLYNTEHLQITVGTLSSNVFANRREYFINIINKLNELLTKFKNNQKYKFTNNSQK